MLSIFYVQEKLKVTRVGNGCGGVLYIYIYIHTHTHTHTYICVLSHVRLFPWTVGSTRLFCSWNCPGKNTRVGCHLLLPGNLPNPATELVSPVSPALAGEFCPTESPGKPNIYIHLHANTSATPLVIFPCFLLLSSINNCCK